MKVFAHKVLRLVPVEVKDLLHRQRLAVVFTVQVALILLSHVLAFTLRFEGDIPPDYWSLMIKSLPVVGLVYWVGLLAFGIQRGLWRYVGLHDLGRIFLASLTSTGCLYFYMHFVLGWVHYPRSVIILTGLLSIGFLAGVRLGVRWIREWLNIIEPTARRVLIVGAGNAGELLAHDMLTDTKYDYRPVGFVDDDPVKQHVKIHGIPVLGPIFDMQRVVERCQPHEMIIAIPSATSILKQKILRASESCKIPIKMLPSLKERLEAAGSMQRVRPMKLEDLLQREPVRTDLQELHPLIEGRKVLVTGAGGSIGAELCRQIAIYKPASLTLFERHENSLYTIDRELRGKFPRLNVLPVVGNITDHDRVSAVFHTVVPHLVFHAAAHKHVPLMESNPGEAIRNNIFGTRVIGEVALEVGVEEFVLISTDKAINPVSVMGMTKRVAECLIQDWNRRGSTRFTAVRFGNVLGSNGSVVPLFKEQIEAGGPVTVTHPEVKRYFMTIPEAVQLVLQASVMSEGGDIFVLDMGEPIRVADLAKNMIVLSGLVPDQDIKIHFTGLRPGEKLNEELFNKQEQVGPTGHPKIKRAVGKLYPDGVALHHPLEELHASLNSQDQQTTIQKLCEIVAVQAQTTVESKQ